MAVLPENTIKVIRQNDPDLSSHLDFQHLRREGLTHIGKLSGKIWTDHNAHDPGVTILEALCYALIDLGYRVNLPFEDIIAKSESTGTDDNFLTPLEALTVNPVTITDYRKLLLEIEGVRNAWLEPVVPATPQLMVDENNNRLFCIDPTSPGGGAGYNQLQLNGLYKILLEKEVDEDSDAITEAARKLFAAHRNLCEDVHEIKVLESEEIGVCAEVELLPGAEAEEVYRNILQSLRQFIQPEVKYYTLQEMLDKGKSIDEAFAGRPYLEDSYGFVDTDELEQLPFREAIYLSDLYNVILSIEGVRKINKIQIIGGEKLTPDSFNWTEGSGLNGKVAVFSLENTCVDLYNQAGVVKLNKNKIHQSFANRKKASLSSEFLDTSIPPGIYRKDLSDYYSIQHDFPVVYGIGEDGLPDSATVKRQAQALQLKGYLLFYDQILAAYLAQLSNVRSLFSFKAEYLRTAEEKITYPAQIPESVTGIEKLIRFYDDNENGLSKNDTIAIPVPNDERWCKVKAELQTNGRAVLNIENHCDSKSVDNAKQVRHFKTDSALARSIQVNQLVDAFNDGDYSIEVLRDKFGCFFVFEFTHIPELLLVGNKKYQSEAEARQAAEQASFIATLKDNYTFDTRQNTSGGKDTHYFDLVYQPVAYAKFIQQLSENEALYYERREQFLDHLLARFSEQFTDYALLQYQEKTSTQDIQRDTVNKQSLFLNNYADISRNRGKAFNYLQEAWNTDNVSGFEKRIAALLGIEDYQRRNLCNFEVIQCFKSGLKDDKGAVLYRASQSYKSYDKMIEGTRKVLSDLRDASTYDQLEGRLQGFNRKATARMFSPQANPKENIVVSKLHHRIELKNHQNELIRESKNNKFTSRAAAEKTLPAFIEKINEQSKPGEAKNNNELALVKLQNGSYLDVNALPLEVNTLISWKWHILTAGGKKKTSSPLVFEQEADAWKHLEQNGILDDYLSQEDNAWSWKVKLPDSDFELKSHMWYPNGKNALTAWLQAKTLGQDATQYQMHKISEEEQVIQLKNIEGRIVAESSPVKDSGAVEEYLKVLVQLFETDRAVPEYVEDRGKYTFQIPDEKGKCLLQSYCAYNSRKEALQAMSEIYEAGSAKKQYYLSGDVANPEYKFLLLGKQGDFIAETPKPFEGAKKRGTALTATTKFLKKSNIPVTVEEEPRRYEWYLRDEAEQIRLKSDKEFESKETALKNFNQTAIREIQNGKLKDLNKYFYQTHFETRPAKYQFVYGVSDECNDWQPLFESKKEYNSPDEAAGEYSRFVNNLDQLEFVRHENPKATQYQLSAKGADTPVAVQYDKDGVKGSVERAASTVAYMQSAYSNAQPSDEFIQEYMGGSTEGSYQWRFYKKNSPVAIVPRACDNRDDAQQLHDIVCQIDPFINLKTCPKPEVVICPKGDPDKYHFQIRFRIKSAKKPFVLYSYKGYDSYQEAKDAYEEEWFDLIQLAKNPENYGDGKAISVEEIYNKPATSPCDEDGTKAVIPKECLDLAEGNVQALIDYFVLHARVFPIFRITETEEGEEPKIYYKFKVAYPTELESLPCQDLSTESEPGTIIWLSTDCFDTIEEAVEAYQDFFPIAENPNTCRIYCEDGKFRVGSFEILVESECDFASIEEAWDQYYPFDSPKDPCGNCKPGGVREFVEAAENKDLFICTKEGERWKFKVVAPDYFVVQHSCTYDSRLLRDAAMKDWISYLDEIDWGAYIPNLEEIENDNQDFENILLQFDWGQQILVSRSLIKKLGAKGWLCELIEGITTCEKEYGFNQKSYSEKIAHINQCLDGIAELLENEQIPLAPLTDMTKRFPVYKTDEGYCFRLYFPENDFEHPDLVRCGCEEDPVKEPVLTHVAEKNVIDRLKEHCADIYPFVSKQCYDCCEGALEAFRDFCLLVVTKKYSTQSTTIDCYGPHGFCIINPDRVLGYHPQQYQSLEDVQDAIRRTCECLEALGMHLVEHILLRPRSSADCHYFGDHQEVEHCLLPICPESECKIDWVPSTDEDDPCAEFEEPLRYMPGTDPYSFWATIALPSWKKQFRDKDARSTIEYLLYQEVPALVGLNIVWLSPRDMCKFEDEYRLWLEWLPVQSKFGSWENWKKHKGNKNRCGDANEPPQCALVNCIADLRTEAPCPVAPQNDASCHCQTIDVVPPDPCCLPPDTEGTIFWLDCPPTIVGHGHETVLSTHSVVERGLTASATAAPDVDAIADIAEKPLIEKKAKKASPKKAAPKAKTAAAKPEKTAAKPPTKKAATKPVEKATKKTTKASTPKKAAAKKAPATKKATPKKATPKKAKTTARKSDTMAVVRKRMPRYLANVQKLTDKRLTATQSYGRTVFFLENVPSLPGYIQLLKFFVKNSLGKSGGVPDEQYHELLKNASWHMFDKIALEKASGLSKDDLDNLSSNLAAASKKGFDLKAVSRGWRPGELKELAKAEPLAQLKKVLKTK